jgi:hypothetical protein
VVDKYNGSRKIFTIAFDSKYARPSGKFPALMFATSSVMLVRKGPSHGEEGEARWEA